MRVEIVYKDPETNTIAKHVGEVWALFVDETSRPHAEIGIHVDPPGIEKGAQWFRLDSILSWKDLP